MYKYTSAYYIHTVLGTLADTLSPPVRPTFDDDTQTTYRVCFEVTLRLPQSHRISLALIPGNILSARVRTRRKR